MKVQIYVDGEQVPREFDWPAVPRIGEVIYLEKQWHEVTSIGWKIDADNQPIVAVVMKVRR